MCRRCIFLFLFISLLFLMTCVRQTLS